MSVINTSFGIYSNRHLLILCCYANIHVICYIAVIQVLYCSYTSYTRLGPPPPRRGLRSQKGLRPFNPLQRIGQVFQHTIATSLFNCPGSYESKVCMTKYTDNTVCVLVTPHTYSEYMYA